MPSLEDPQAPSPYAVPFKPGKCEFGVRSITQCSLNGKGRDGFTIDQSGEYHLKESIVFNPKHANTQAITITASDVTLNLGTYSLTQGNRKTGVWAIVIGRDAQNVKIIGDNKNLPILSCSSGGIYFLDHQC